MRARTSDRLVAGAALAAVLAAGGGRGAASTTGGSGPTSPPSDAAVVLTLPSSTGAPLLTFTGRLIGAGATAGASAGVWLADLLRAVGVADSGANSEQWIWSLTTVEVQ